MLRPLPARKGEEEGDDEGAKTTTTKRRWKKTRSQPTNPEPYRLCVPFTLPAEGTIRISPDQTVTLTADAVFTPLCAAASNNDTEMGGVTSIADTQEPFHASIAPQVYATGAATVIAWMLVIMLVITPRTFFVGGVGGRSGLMGRRGMIGGASGGGSIIGVGTRPWLQKVAALTVAISLTLATADTFKIAERQYESGFMNASQLRLEVVGGKEIRVSRIISDIFLWLAQVQTLIRLFPRHKEKVIIKWVGFALVLLDIIFACLNSFGGRKGDPLRTPQHFKTAIPALSYLFQLALSMLYAAWVIYYAITKRRYAFYHPMMWNISIVCLLSIVAILTPVVFFITDITRDSVAGWGDYFRWVGAAAASVIVWEWVERIEALEREERKDGILGREIYDGDEMLETTPYIEVNSSRQQRNNQHWAFRKSGPEEGQGGAGGLSSGSGLHGLSTLAQRLSGSRFRREAFKQTDTALTVLTKPPVVRRRTDEHNPYNSIHSSEVPLRPEPIVSPVSRTDTTSADSTVYTIRYHPISATPPNRAQPTPEQRGFRQAAPNIRAGFEPGGERNEDLEKPNEEKDAALRNRSRWYAANPFKRRRASPPPEVQRGRVIEPLGIEDVSTLVPSHPHARWALRSRLGAFAAEQGEKIREKTNGGRQTDSNNLPVTIIPAQPRGRTWSPEILQQLKEQSNQHPDFGSGSRVLPGSQPSDSAATGSSRAYNAQSSGPSSVHHMENVEVGYPYSVRHNEDIEVGGLSSVPAMHHFGTPSSLGSSSRIRFTPQSFHRPVSRLPDTGIGNRSQMAAPPTNVDLGTEVRPGTSTTSTSTTSSQESFGPPRTNDTGRPD